jgi:hypothetical protein
MYFSQQYSTWSDVIDVQASLVLKWCTDWPGWFQQDEAYTELPLNYMHLQTDIIVTKSYTNNSVFQQITENFSIHVYE